MDAPGIGKKTAARLWAEYDGKAIERLRNAPIDSIVVTDSIPIPPQKMLPNMKILSVAPVLAEAIKRIHQHKSISAIFGNANAGDE